MDRTTDAVAVRASLVLTTAYVATTGVPMTVYGKIGIFFDFTIGSLTSMEAKVQLSDVDSPGASDWYDLLDNDGTALEPEIATATGRFYWTPEPIITAKQARVMVKGTGTVTSSLLAVEVCQS